MVESIRFLENILSSSEQFYISRELVIFENMEKRIDDFDHHLKIINQAMKIEKESQASYEDTMEEVDNSKVERWLSSLKFDEIIHFAVLERLGGLIEDKKSILTKMGDEFSYPNLSSEEAESVYEDVQKHLKIERKQIERLEDLQGMDLSLVNIDSKIEWLKEEEEEHHEQLSKFAQWLEENYDFQ